MAVDSARYARGDLSGHAEVSAADGTVLGRGVSGGAGRLANATNSMYLGQLSTLPSIILEAGSTGVIGDVLVKSKLHWLISTVFYPQLFQIQNKINDVFF